MAALSLASLLLAEAGPAAAALLPLSEQMLWQHFGDAVPPANSGYGRQRRRRMEALTPENTQRIRLKVDYTSLYPDTAAKYSACFNVGDWYARGLPGPDPPADGVATCRGDTSDKDCWGKCAEIDLITEIGRSMMIAVVDRVINEVEGLFALIPSQEPLTFDKSPGRYAGAYLDNGYASEDKCARDCTMLSGVAVNDDYCDTGFYTDAVVSLVKPATIPGVAGTGGACASDSTGRPTWLVFSWIQSINEATASGSNMAKRNGEDDETAVRRLVEEYRGLVIHELLHALGFTNAKFRAARDAAGNRKDLITLKPVTDLDGTKDEVWFFTKGRAYELAQDYFGCYDNSTWDGLPLMGLPELGRATHWETRIMRDDVMTYGRTLEAVSSITLASMEDLGFYLANYSAAECISWGYKQGCNYVATRCGAGIDDQSQTDVAKNDCKGNPNWGLAWNTYLTEKCAGGTTPCEQGSGWSDSGRKCNAQCYTGPNRAGCKTAPTSKLEGAGSGGISDYVPNVNWEQFLFLASWVLGGLTFFGVLRNFICPKKGSAKVLCATSTFFVLAGLATVVFNVLVLARIETIPELDVLGAQVEAFIGQYVMAGFLSIGLVLFIVGLVTIIGLCRASEYTMLFVWLIWLIMLLLQITLAVVICWWIFAIQDVPNETLATLQGTSDGRYEGQLGAEAFVEMEGFVCILYQKCCRDPVLDLVPIGQGAEIEAGSGNETLDYTLSNNRTCLYSHEGTTSDIEISLQDPSSPKFCPYITGSDYRIAPPTGICNPLDKLFPLELCRENFCLSGAEGYYEFLMELIGFIKNYATGFGGLFAIHCLIELVLLVNLWNLRSRFKKEKEMNQQQAHSSEMGFQVMAGGSVLGPDGRPVGKVRKESAGGHGSNYRSRGSAGGAGTQMQDLRSI